MKRYSGFSFSLIACFYCLFSITASFEVKAQKPVQMSSGELLHAMKKLNVLGSVLYMAAHPDDENTKLITYFSNQRTNSTILAGCH